MAGQGRVLDVEQRCGSVDVYHRYCICGVYLSERRLFYIELANNALIGMMFLVSNGQDVRYCRDLSKLGGLMMRRLMRRRLMRTKVDEEDKVE